VALPDAFAATDLDPVAWRVDHVTLFRSHLQRPAPRYEALQTFPLGTVPAP
jgi:2'-5' RNA ligase